MSASLVGSEMCIRDSAGATVRPHPMHSFAVIYSAAVSACEKGAEWVRAPRLALKSVAHNGSAAMAQYAPHAVVACLQLL
eukprot:9139717-Alexandrium_andersonii.AAC.1